MKICSNCGAQDISEDKEGLLCNACYWKLKYVTLKNIICPLLDEMRTIENSFDTYTTLFKKLKKSLKS